MSFDPADSWPFSPTRSIEDFPIANLPLSEHQQQVIGTQPVSIHTHVWLDPTDFSDFIASGKSTLIDAAKLPLVWRGASADLDSCHTATDSFIIRYPWDLLRANEQFVSALSADFIQGTVHPMAVVEGVLHLGAGTRILPGVFIEGNVVIGENCKIGPNCYIRGNTSIGDGCHIGQSVEIKNCLILSKTNVGHLSYIGDSVLGEKVNLGAGTTTSNLRHDGKNHRSMVGDALVDTGRRKFGTIIGDHVHTGINTSIYPGRKLGPHTHTRPAEVVQHDLKF
jgi:bifunctional UDP-N-acetylglucosamine pyrophosphorylase/glucosamine-1-phosphate N-acetyltransferase